MKKLMIILSLLLVMAGVYAVPFTIDYSYVNTDSGIEYLSIQYGNYYDNVSMKLKLRAEDIPSGYSYVPVIVSPQVYGINGSGNLDYLYSVPSSTYYLSNATEYYYPNLFYLTPEYQGYVIQVNAQSGQNYYTTSSAYVYPVGAPSSYFYPVDDNTNPNDNSQETQTTCSSFFLSGRRDIYLEEDDEENYKLYIENDSSEELTVLSVTADDSSELDISDIDYPDYVSGNYVGTVNLSLESDTISDDEDSSFDIYVRARYGSGQECLKTYTVDYHINDEDNDNTSSCSDISIDNTKFTLDEESFELKTVKIVNESEDYDFEIDDITIDDDSYISSRIRDEPTIVREDSTEDIEIEFETEAVNYTTTKNIDLEIEGYLVRSGREDKKCTKRENLVITIRNEGTSSSSSSNNNSTIQSCKDIVLYTTNIQQLENTNENYSEENGFFIANNSNQQFSITSLSINDNSNKAEIRNVNYDSSILSKDKEAIAFELITNSVSTTENPKGSISVSGRFADGKTCSTTEIGVKQFNIGILDSSDLLCSNIGVYDKTITSGTNNNIQIFNNTNKKFYVTNVLFQNRYGLSGNVTNKQLTVNSNSQNTMSVGFTGNGSLEMLISGKFEDGKTCDFTKTASGFLVSENQQINLSDDVCDSKLIVPTSISVNNAIEYLNLNFINRSSRGGKILISGNGLAIEPNIILLNGFDSFNKEIELSNFNNPTNIYFDVLLNNCSSKRYFTVINNNISESERINIVSYPTLITPLSNNVNISTTVNNSFAVSKSVTLKLSGFPETFSSTPKTLEILAHDRKSISLTLSIPESAEKRAYNGYIELYSGNNLIKKYPITIDLSPKTDPITISASVENQDKVYYLKINLKNNSSITQNTIIDFGLDDSYVIEGDKEINILPGEEIIKQYKIVSPAILKENKTVDLKIKDKATEEVLAKEKVILKSNSSAITGFLTLGNMGLIVLGLVVLIVIVIIFRRK